MAPTLQIRYLLRVTHVDGLFIRTDPVPSPSPGVNRLYTIPTGYWVPAYDVLSLENGVYAIIVPTHVESEFCKVSESTEYDGVTGIGTYCRVYALVPQPYNPHVETLHALQDIATAIRERKEQSHGDSDT